MPVNRNERLGRKIGSQPLIALQLFHRPTAESFLRLSIRAGGRTAKHQALRVRNSQMLLKNPHLTGDHDRRTFPHPKNLVVEKHQGHTVAERNLGAFFTRINLVCFHHRRDKSNRVGRIKILIRDDVIPARESAGEIRD